MACLYIITGASGCGKTTLINGIATATRDSVDPTLADRVADAVIDSETRAVRAPKYSKRDVRVEGNDIDDIIHLDEISLDTCDVAYVINGEKYGLQFKPIEELLNNGYNCCVAVSDLRVVRELKVHFRNRAKAVYLSSAIDPQKLKLIQLQRSGFHPDEDQKALLSRHFAKVSAGARLGWWERVSECMLELERDWQAYATDTKSTEVRQQRIRATHIRYIDHISLFDHVILNYTEVGPNEMFDQMRNLIRSNSSGKSKDTKNPAPVFVVAAASGAGKGTLTEMLNLIGRDRIRIVSKLAKRKPKPKDRPGDGMIKLFRGPGDPEPEWPTWWTPEMIKRARTGEFPEEYDLQWPFHKTSENDDSTATWYAISKREVQDNIENKIPQILVSNMGEFGRFRELWPDNVVFLYLHRLSSDKEHRQYQIENCQDNRVEADVRIAEKEKVHCEFIRRIGEFDHVLLNTSYEEDLYDQMFHLIAHYRGFAKPTSSASSHQLQRVERKCGA